jgi:hypothetical protein
MNSNEKTFNYKVLNLVKYYNFGISIREVWEIQKIESQNIWISNTYLRLWVTLN